MIINSITSLVCLEIKDILPYCLCWLPLAFVFRSFFFFFPKDFCVCGLKVPLQSIWLLPTAPTSICFSTCSLIQDPCFVCQSWPRISVLDAPAQIFPKVVPSLRLGFSSNALCTVGPTRYPLTLWILAIGTT